MRISAFLLALVLPGLALAGRPLSTEDASTLEDKACQLESWVDRTRGDVTGAFFVPACSWFDTEFQAGASRAWAGGRSATVLNFVQAKHAFKSVDDGDWGIGLVAGLSRYPQREEKNDWGDPYFIVPLSIGFGADKETRALLHLNIGTARVRDEGRNLTLWGVAIEKPATDRLTLLAEAFGENSRNPFIRAGGRYALFDKFDIDLTYVTRSGGSVEDRYWSLGFHWETAPFLP
ncbi:MAG: hypothetical protein IPP91_15525 [Betaproteobacteria bacterium]|nr:hypothetical protein [Betaproteobacteria bacterium]